MAVTDSKTIDRLLDAAEGLFAEHGFAATSVRDITQQAGCNVSAVNYHFGSKEGLYERVFERRLELLRTVRLEAVGRVVEDAAAHEDLALLMRAFAHAFLAPLLDPDHGARTVQLMMRELITPKLPQGMIFKHLIGPIQEAMVTAIVRCVPGLHQGRALLCLHSFIGQLVHVLQMSRIQHMGGEDASPLLEINHVLDHVVRFTVLGVQAMVADGSEVSGG